VHGIVCIIGDSGGPKITCMICEPQPPLKVPNFANPFNVLASSTKEFYAKYSTQQSTSSFSHDHSCQLQYSSHLNKIKIRIKSVFFFHVWS